MWLLTAISPKTTRVNASSTQIVTNKGLPRLRTGPSHSQQILRTNLRTKSYTVSMIDDSKPMKTLTLAG